MINLSEQKFYDFLNFLLEYSFKSEMLSSFFHMLIPKIIKEDDCDNNKKFLPKIEYDNKKTMVNFINLNTLGESLFVVKNRYSADNKDIHYT